MSEDPTRQLEDFPRQGIEVDPRPASEVRRRGDQMRRRNNVGAALGGVVAAAVIATPLVMVSLNREDAARPPALSEAPSSNQAGELPEEALLSVDQVPTRERLTAWQQADLVGTPTLSCQPQPLAVLDADVQVERTFYASIAGSPAEDPSSTVNTAVLQFADDAATSAAYTTVSSWIADCANPQNGLEPFKDKAVHNIDGAHGEWRLRIFSAPDVCTECDAARFARMGVAQVGNRLLLVELAEVGGPVEPEGLDATMTDLFDAAIASAR